MNTPTRGAVLGGIAAIALGVAAPAMAAHTVVTVGGDSSPDEVSVEGTNSTPSIQFISNRGTTLTCAGSEIVGTVLQGASVDVGEKVGEITDLTFSPCTASSLNLPVTVTMTAGDITVREHPASAGDDLEVTIDVPAATITGTGCSFTAAGSVDAVIHPGSNGTAAPDGEIELVPVDFSDITTFDLNVTVPGGGSTCGGEVHDGDAAGPSDLVSSIFELDTLGEGDINHG